MSIIEKLTLLVPILLVVGASWKYLPVLQKVANEVVIPVLNALVALLVAFVGPAHAGILGDVGAVLSGPAKVFLALTASALAALIHDKYLKPILPPSPYTK